MHPFPARDGCASGSGVRNGGEALRADQVSSLVGVGGLGLASVPLLFLAARDERSQGTRGSEASCLRHGADRPHGVMP